jgi:hypothetical protein
MNDCFHTFATMQADNNMVEEFQHTLQAPTSIKGVGIHSGKPVEMILLPQNPIQVLFFNG